MSARFFSLLLALSACGAPASSLISTTDEPAGANCLQGGTRMDYGLDDDGSGALDGEEIDGTTYICDGTTPPPGLNSLVDTEDEPAGENCEWGGTAVSYGVDDDDDGALSTEEVDGVAYVCDPRPCDGWLFDAGGGMGCWYNAPVVDMSCNQLCDTHGGFDIEASTHIGNPVGVHFWASKAGGGTWMSVEVSSIDNNTNWGATGDTPDGDFSHNQSLVNCACLR